MFKRILTSVILSMAMIVMTMPVFSKTEVPVFADESAVYDVTSEEFGANGSDSASDTAAIQKALSKAKDASGGITVKIPAGTYYIDSTLRIYSSTTLDIDSSAVIIRTANVSIVCGDYCNNSASGSSAVGGYAQASNIIVKGGTFDDSSNSFASPMLEFAHAEGITVQGVTFKGGTKNQMAAYGVKTLTVDGCTFKDAKWNESSSATLEQANKNAALYVADVASDGTAYPLDGTESVSANIVNNTFENLVSGVWVDGSSMTVNANSFKNVMYDCIRATNASSLQVMGNISASSGRFLHLESASGAEIGGATDEKKNQIGFAKPESNTTGVPDFYDASYSDAILVENSSDVSLRNNAVSTSIGNGIHCVSSSINIIMNMLDTSSFKDIIAESATSGSIAYYCDDTLEINPDSSWAINETVLHKYNSSYTVDVAATCTEAGRKSIHCQYCDEVLLGSEATINALGHDFAVKEGDEEVAATCNHEGKTALKTCTRCGYSEGGEVIPKREHIFGEWQVIETPSCSASGFRRRYCTQPGCDAYEDEGINASDHDWQEDYTIDKEATCLEDGLKSIHCKNCDATKDAEVISSAGAHSWKLIQSAVRATTTSSGKEAVYKCTVCGTITGGNSIPKIVENSATSSSEETPVATEAPAKVTAAVVNTPVDFTVNETATEAPVATTAPATSNVISDTDKTVTASNNMHNYSYTNVSEDGRTETASITDVDDSLLASATDSTDNNTGIADKIEEDKSTASNVKKAAEEVVKSSRPLQIGLIIAAIIVVAIIAGLILFKIFGKDDDSDDEYEYA